MFKSILTLLRPITLFLAALTYSLGAGIAHYLGHKVSAAVFGLGLLAVLTLLSASFLFTEYFRFSLVPLAQNETFRQREHLRVLLLQVSFAELTLSVVAILTLLLVNSLNLSAGVFLAITLVLVIVYAIPPMRLAEIGYGEIVLAVIIGTLLPAIAFLLQFGQVHRLVSFTTFPLTLLALAYLLVGNFPTYATDQKIGRHTLLTRLTWQRAVPIHHCLILIAFLFFALTPLLQFPWSLVWPVFLDLPFMVIQIIWLQRIADGGPTFWNLLSPIASASFGLAVYLLAMTYWIR
jgi:1,4-dihydroxy-2-naphthoate octaprenyltransferase